MGMTTSSIVWRNSSTITSLTTRGRVFHRIVWWWSTVKLRMKERSRERWTRARARTSCSFHRLP